MRNVLVTGIPRSGTTLAAAIIDSCMNAFCLSEPDHHVDLSLKAATVEDFVASLVEDLASIRRKLQMGLAVADRRAFDGGPLTNYFSPRRAEATRQASYALVERGKAGLSPDFTLAIKHNALFTAALPALSQSGEFDLVAIVRDPTDTILSWRSLDLPVSRGRLPAAEKFWPEMRDIAATDLPLLDKHIWIIEAFCRRYLSLTPAVKTFRYGAIVSDPRQFLISLGLGPRSIDRSLVASSTVGQTEEARQIVLRVRDLAGSGQLPGISEFYPEYGRG